MLTARARWDGLESETAARATQTCDAACGVGRARRDTAARAGLGGAGKQNMFPAVSVFISWPDDLPSEEWERDHVSRPWAARRRRLCLS